MISSFITLSVVGVFTGWIVTRGARVSVNIDQWALSGALVALFAALLFASYNYEKGVCVSGLAFGMLMFFALKVMRLRRLAPTSFSSERGRGGQVKDVYAGPDGWEAVHSDGSTVSYDRCGRVTGMTFSDGSHLDLS